jgi:hypothetical protein
MNFSSRRVLMFYSCGPGPPAGIQKIPKDQTDNDPKGENQNQGIDTAAVKIHYRLFK